MVVRKGTPIEEVLDEYNISWSYGDNEKNLKTINMFKEFLENYSISEKYEYNVSFTFAKETKNKESRDSYKSVTVLNNPYAA